jgi:hypothetical protein
MVVTIKSREFQFKSFTEGLGKVGYVIAAVRLKLWYLTEWLLLEKSRLSCRWCGLIVQGIILWPGVWSSSPVGLWVVLLIVGNLVGVRIRGVWVVSVVWLGEGFYGRKGGRGIGSWCWCKLQWELLLLECQACGCGGRPKRSRHSKLWIFRWQVWCGG